MLTERGGCEDQQYPDDGLKRELMDFGEMGTLLAF
jgi:hypothetical protein